MRAIRSRAGCWLLPVLAASLFGCIPPKRASIEQLRVRAAFDLGCPQHLLQHYHLDERTKGVVGCGWRLVYVETCGPVGDHDVCTWVLDQPPNQPHASVPAGADGAAVSGALGARPTNPAVLHCTVAAEASSGPAVSPAATPMPPSPYHAPMVTPAPSPPPTASAPALDPFGDRH